MGDDLRHRQLIFFFGILFIEDAVGFVAETDTTETVMTRITVKTIE